MKPIFMDVSCIINWRFLVQHTLPWYVTRVEQRISSILSGLLELDYWLEVSDTQVNLPMRPLQPHHHQSEMYEAVEYVGEVPREF